MDFTEETEADNASTVDSKTNTPSKGDKPVEHSDTTKPTAKKVRIADEKL